MVAVLVTIVVFTLAGGLGGDVFDAGGGRSPLGTPSNGGGTTLTIAHFSRNQFHVGWRSGVVQVRAKQGAARTKNPLLGAQTQVHYSSAPNKSWYHQSSSVVPRRTTDCGEGGIRTG